MEGFKQKKKKKSGEFGFCTLALEPFNRADISIEIVDYKTRGLESKRSRNFTKQEGFGKSA